MLRTGFRELSGVVYTHFHADHIMGLDDLRPFNFRMRREINVYADESSASRIESIFHYAFNPDPDYQGGAPPKLVMNRIEAGTPFQVGELILKPLAIMHGKQSILGFRIGNFAYLTDCSGIPQVTQVELSGLELIAVSGLRHRPHPTHFTITQAVRAIEALDVKRGLLTHISHEIDHAEAEQFIRGLTTREIGLACDEMMVEL
jgi:phosphoribosyl 1,2-cyclic phosphate phosphodiesterase